MRMSSEMEEKKEGPHPSNRCNSCRPQPGAYFFLPLRPLQYRSSPPSAGGAGRKPPSASACRPAEAMCLNRAGPSGEPPYHRVTTTRTFVAFCAFRERKERERRSASRAWKGKEDGGTNGRFKQRGKDGARSGLTTVVLPYRDTFPRQPGMQRKDD